MHGTKSIQRSVCVCVRVTETDNVLTFIESFLNNSAHNDIVYQMCAIFLMIMCHVAELKKYVQVL